MQHCPGRLPIKLAAEKLGMQTTWGVLQQLRKAILTLEAHFNADSQINTGHFSFGRQNFSTYATTLSLLTFKFFNSVH